MLCAQSPEMLCDVNFPFSNHIIDIVESLREGVKKENLLVVESGPVRNVQSPSPVRQKPFLLTFSLCILKDPDLYFFDKRKSIGSKGKIL